MNVLPVQADDGVVALTCGNALSDTSLPDGVASDLDDACGRDRVAADVAEVGSA